MLSDIIDVAVTCGCVSSDIVLSPVVATVAAAANLLLPMLVMMMIKPKK